MIIAGYSDEDIILRLRVSKDLMEAIHKQIELSKIVEDKEDWDEYE